MATPTFHFTFEKDWLTAPMAYWVHVPDENVAGSWVPPAPSAAPHKGFAVMRVAVDTHELQFSSPAQLAHLIDVLATKQLPTSRQLSFRRGDNVGPNGHWLSRFPSSLKSPRRRERLVAALRAIQAVAVRQDGLTFELSPVRK